MLDHPSSACSASARARYSGAVEGFLPTFFPVLMAGFFDEGDFEAPLLHFCVEQHHAGWAHPACGLSSCGQRAQARRGRWAGVRTAGGRGTRWWLRAVLAKLDHAYGDFFGDGDGLVLRVLVADLPVGQEQYRASLAADVVE